jgi:hypothetical protein
MYRPSSLLVRCSRSRKDLATAVIALFIGGAGLAGLGCAMGGPPDTTPDPTTGLPGVDVGNDPKPAPGTKSAEAGTGGSTGTTGSDPDAGTKSSLAPPDAAAPDAAPVVPKPSAGEVLITEVMYATFTPEPASEWFEVHSTAASVRSLGGLTIKDGSGRTHPIAAGLTIAPGAYLVLARNKAAAITAKVPAAAIAYEYGAGLPDNAGILLTNGATGGVSLVDGATNIATAPYGGWFSQSGGSSVQLKVLDPTLTNTKASWCLSLNAWTTGAEKGTPGAAEDCP